jgi:thiamine pyrophosphate-dependent acetolactate synthase large subunit-like protein
MARQRGRPVENKWIGQRIAGPDIDIAMMARAQGAHTLGPVREPSALADALRQAVAATVAGRTVVVDVEVAPGYEAEMLTTMLGTAQH